MSGNDYVVHTTEELIYLFICFSEKQKIRQIFRKKAWFFLSIGKVYCEVLEDLMSIRDPKVVF